MKDNIYPFRSLKHGDPKKLKMIPDRPSAWKRWRFIVFAIGYLITLVVATFIYGRII